MKGGKRGENQNGSDESSDSEEESTDPKTPDKSDPPLFSVPAAASSGRPAAASSGRPAAASSDSPARNTRKTIRKGEAAEKKHQKRRKT